METMTAFEAATRYPVNPPPPVRRPHAATIVAAVYVALVLGAPGIVRFAPDLDTRWLTAVTQGRPHIHCAASPEAPSPCATFAVAALGRGAPTPTP